MFDDLTVKLMTFWTNQYFVSQTFAKGTVQTKLILLYQGLDFTIRNVVAL